MELAEEIRNPGQQLGSATGAAVILQLNEVLNRYLGWPYRATTAYATDREGNKTATFGTVIYTTSDTSATVESVVVPADALAAVVEVFECIDLEAFRAAYRRIGEAKVLKKSPAPSVGRVAHTTTTLGIIFALRATLPLEKFAEEMESLNKQTPSNQWPDMLAVLSTGIINYGLQFPGEGMIIGDFLPPAEGAAAAQVVAAYVIMVTRPTATYTFNKFGAFLFGHLAIFSPGANIPNFALVLEGAPQLAITGCGYQYNLSGDLLPVPRQFYNDRYLPRLPFRIEDRKGNLLSTVQFLPWQDGGVILLRGKLPLVGILVYLGRDALKRGQIITRADLQISPVLAINEARFLEILARFQQQSNMVVRNQAPKLVIQKILDEGTQSPFIARVSLGILRLREIVFSGPSQRDSFDKAFEPIFMDFPNTRAAAQELAETWREHVRKVSQGEIAHVLGETIQVDENIDKKMKKQIEGFLNAAVRTLKQAIPNVTMALGVNIGFLFQKASAFDKGLAALAATDPDLAEYLRQTRASWSERLLQIRNAMEHEGWTLPKAIYALDGVDIKVNEPSISDQPVLAFVATMIDRLSCFTEEVIVHCLQMRMPEGISISEIPLSQRAREVPERFQLALATGGLPMWRIAYHQESFEET
jgi:hypothetical protein